MSLTATEEALVRELLAEQAAILSLAGSESTIISKLGATKVTLADLTAASSAADSDLMLIRQGTTEKSITPLVLIPNASETVNGKVELATIAEVATGTDTVRAVTPSGAAFITKQIQQISASVAANALTITLNPTVIDFRSSAIGSGTVNRRYVSSAISVVISSGSTLGTINATQSRIAVLAIDNAGTVELAVVNLAGGNSLDETGVINTTAEGGAGGADSASVIYSTTARTGVPYRVVGYIESTQAAAGSWDTSPSTIQGSGGQAMSALSAIGYGQTWQNLTGSRAFGTTYYNTTGKPIEVKVLCTNGSGGNTGYTLTVGGQVVSTHESSTAAYNSGTLSAIVPPGASYLATLTTGTGTLVSWKELR